MTMIDYSGIKALAVELGRRADSLVVLARHNDPFFIGPTRQAWAAWFANEWHRLGIQTGWHYRRIHYIFMSQDPPIRMVDGTPYTNTIEAWGRLCWAARDAIALGLVPQNAFADHRNAEPIVHLVQPSAGGTSVSDDEPDVWLPEFPSLPELSFTRPIVPQPYHIEVWVEKTTVNDVLEPLAGYYKFNLVTGTGELSATRCREFVDRVGSRPVRILYISDFDPGGASMPVAAARKIEFEIHRRGLDVDVQLRPIVLTHEQCVEYSLPRTPLKETEVRGARFQARFGEGGTELDALEALHPGQLRKIVTREVRRYWNPDHAAAVDERSEDIEEELAGVTTAAHDAHRDEIDELRADWREIVAKIEGWRERANPVWQAVRDRLVQDHPSLDAVEPPEFSADEDPDPLFDSTRTYLEQIDRYKRHQGKGDGDAP
jgi:hypothetical protein